MPSSYRSNTEADQARSKSIERALWLLGILALIFSFYGTTVGFHHSLYDFYGFRQAQTAISAYSILLGGSFLHYETPVVGPPWSIPFEFPLYQWIVAEIARFFSIPLDETGRFVSILFYYLCFFPLASILSRIGLRRSQMVPALVLFAVCPLYVFVSHVFMIESTALFFSLMYADQMFRLVLSPSPWQYRYIAGAAIFGVLAGVVKVTTLAPYFVVGSCLALWGVWQLWKNRTNTRFRFGLAAAVGVFCLLLPVAITLLWTKFADGLKAQNPFGVYLTSSALKTWNFGTITQRLRFRPYAHLLLNVNNHLGNIGAAAAVLGVYIWLCRRWNWTAVTCVTLYVGTILLFFNLQVWHEYYSYSIAVFLLVAAGALISSVTQIQGPRAWFGVALLVLEMAACGFRYFTHYYPLQSKDAPGRPAAAAIIDSTTAPDAVILIIGLDWSSEFPYQSHRRAIMDARMVIKSQTLGDVRHLLIGLGPVEKALANEGQQNIAAVVACDDGRHDDRLLVLLRDTGISASTNLHADECDIYLRSVSAVPQVR